MPWQVHTASAIGAGHVRSGLANEDAVAHRLLPPSGGPALLVVAVADGHGDARHFRSERGARMAVAAGISAMRDWSADISGSPGEITRSAQRTLVPDVVTRWNAAVAADLAENRLDAPERALLADLALSPQTAYGSTLLIGAFTESYAVFAQIGDGNIVAVLPDGGWVNPVPEDSRLDGVRTTSLCQADAGAAFRVGVVPLTGRPLSAVLLATDGFGNAQAADPWQPGFAADLVGLAADRDPGWFASQVPEWAAQCASSAGSGDDSTIALVINSAVRPGPVSEPSRGPAHRAVRERRPGSRRRVPALTVAALVVLAGLVLAFLLSGHGHSASPRRPGPSVSATRSATATPSPSTAPSARAITPSAGATTRPARARPSASTGAPRASLAALPGGAHEASEGDNRS